MPQGHARYRLGRELPRLAASTGEDGLDCRPEPYLTRGNRCSALASVPGRRDASAIFRSECLLPSPRPARARRRGPRPDRTITLPSLKSQTVKPSLLETSSEALHRLAASPPSPTPLTSMGASEPSDQQRERPKARHQLVPSYWTGAWCPEIVTEF